MSDFKIVTTHVHPPIPSREWDWSAHFDGEEEGACGWGCSAFSALVDLDTKVEILDLPDRDARLAAITALIEKARP